MMSATAQVRSRPGFPLPEIAFCQEKVNLLAKFYGAVRHIVALHQKAATALMRGDQPLADLDGAMDRAREAKERAKHTYVLHVAHHGCGTELVEPPATFENAASAAGKIVMAA